MLQLIPIYKYISTLVHSYRRVILKHLTSDDTLAYKKYGEKTAGYTYDVGTYVLCVRL